MPKYKGYICIRLIIIWDRKGHDGWFYHIWLLAIVDPLLSSIIGKQTPPFCASITFQFFGVLCKEKETERRRSLQIRVCKKKDKGIFINLSSTLLMASGMYSYLYIYSWDVFDSRSMIGDFIFMKYLSFNLTFGIRASFKNLCISELKLWTIPVEI